MKKYIYIFTGLLITSCSVQDHDPQEEDYQKLFPFKGIEKPEISYDDLTVHPCDLEEALHNFKYPGVDIPGEKRTYTVTLRCRYTQPSGTPNYGSSTSTRFVVRYINENKNIASVGSYDDATEGISADMQNGVEFVKTFQVISGYPMYLSVTGTADRGAGIKAEIQAISDDGLIIVPKLASEQYQNQDGINRIEYPYCQYVILP